MNTKIIHQAMFPAFNKSFHRKKNIFLLFCDDTKTCNVHSFLVEKQQTLTKPIKINGQCTTQYKGENFITQI